MGRRGWAGLRKAAKWIQRWSDGSGMAIETFQAVDTKERELLALGSYRDRKRLHLPRMQDGDPACSAPCFLSWEFHFLHQEEERLSLKISSTWAWSAREMSPREMEALWAHLERLWKAKRFSIQREASWAMSKKKLGTRNNTPARIYIFLTARTFQLPKLPTQVMDHSSPRNETMWHNLTEISLS